MRRLRIVSLFLALLLAGCFVLPAFAAPGRIRSARLSPRSSCRFCRLPLRLLSIVFIIGAMPGATFCLNNVLRLGEDAALFTGIFILSLCEFAFAAALLRRAGKEKEKTV